MIEIKFRALDVKGKMVYGLPYYAYGIGTWFITQSDGWAPSYNNPDQGESTVFIPIDPETLMQFTGLYDKNGTEIYHKDILEYETNSKRLRTRFVIEWDNDNAEFTKFSPKDKFVVIGNIYENPDLLNDGN